MRMLVLVFTALFVASPVVAADRLTVIVVDGDEAANIVADRLAAEPAVEVRDRENRRVPGAVVRFVIRKTRDRVIAAFANGQTEVRTITDVTGRAAINPVTPLEKGSFQIDVEVSYRGDTGKAVIRQTNFGTSAEAKAAGREPGKSTSTNAGAAAGATAVGATAGAPAAAGATAGATTTVGATGATGGAAAAGSAAAGASSTSASVAAAGGGISKTAVAGIVAGGAAGAGAAVYLTQKKEEEPPAIVAPVVASQAVGIYGATVFSFSAQATGFDASTLGYRWDFGDGTSSTDQAPTHVYASPGSYTVAVTVNDARRSARSETTVTILGLTGTWVSTTGRTTLEMTQSGNALSGSSTLTGLDPRTGAFSVYTNCGFTGSMERAPTVPVVLDFPQCRHATDPVFLSPSRMSLTVSPDGRTLIGTLTADGQPSQAATLTRQ